MSRMDLHVHSKFSEQLSEEFLRKLGALESYTEPEFIYAAAKARGMDFVTITDHNRIEGSLRLKERHPDDVFTGVESTVYFPEDGCSVHILVFGLTESQFNDLQRLRSDIYAFRDYLKANGLAHAVAHATYSRNEKLDADKLEKLILLFDVFEGINGGSSHLNNTVWTRVLNGLTPERTDELRRKHGIEPFSDTPWIKGFTGGSDDHAGLFMGRTFTRSRAATAGEFLESIRKKETLAGGKHGDFRSLIFTLYKIAYDFSRARKQRPSRSFFTRVNELIFDNKPLRFREKLGLRKMKYQSARKKDRVQGLLIKLIGELNGASALPVDRKLDLIYDRLSGIGDEFLKSILNAVSRDLQEGDFAGLFRNLSSALPGMLLPVPFMASFGYMCKSRKLTRAVENRFLPGNQERPSKRTLWFTDSIHDLDGRSATLEELRQASRTGGDTFKIATSLIRGAPEGSLPGVMNLETVCTFRPPCYEKHTFDVPSLLKSLEEIYRFEPDEIYVSSLGPLGLLGLLAARLLGVACVGVYHAELYRNAQDTIEARSVSNLVDSYCTWFYSHMDEIKVLVPEHMDVLEGMGLKRARMSAFGTDIRSYFGLGACGPENIGTPPAA